jgi:hypothetical protein
MITYRITKLYLTGFAAGLTKTTTESWEANYPAPQCGTYQESWDVTYRVTRVEVVG